MFVEPTIRIVPMTSLPPFGSLLRSLRQRAGLSQSQLADALDVTRQWIVAIEAGETVPSLQRVDQLHAILAKRIFGTHGTLGQHGEHMELLVHLTHAATEARIGRWCERLAAKTATLRAQASA